MEKIYQLLEAHEENMRAMREGEREAKADKKVPASNVFSESDSDDDGGKEDGDGRTNSTGDHPDDDGEAGRDSSSKNKRGWNALSRRMEQLSEYDLGVRNNRRTSAHAKLAMESSSNRKKKGIKRRGPAVTFDENARR